MSALSITVVVLVLISSLIDAAKILGVFPTPSISHQIVFRTLTQELIKRGHEVVVITPDPAYPNGGAPPNLTEIDVHDISYKLWKEIFVMQSKGRKSDSISQMRVAFELLLVILDNQLQHKDIQKIISKRNTDTFDLLLLESCVRPALIFSHLFKTPVISISSLGGPPGTYEMMGASEHPILYPSVIGFRTFNQTMREKITEIYNSYRFTRFLKNQVAIEDEMLRKRFGSDTPGVEELVNNVDMLFLNTYPVFERIRPVPPSVIYMGGIHQNPTKSLPTFKYKIKTAIVSSPIFCVVVISAIIFIPTISLLNLGSCRFMSHKISDELNALPIPGTICSGWDIITTHNITQKDLKTYMDSSKHGIIYVSFGTNVDSRLLPIEKVQTLVNVFSKLPYDVLFKWDGKELPGCSHNIRTEKWLPQSDLLRHANVKLFITQGGLQSTDEAITAGVPMIGIPMLADQWYNVENYVRHGIGIQLDLETLTEEKLTNAINDIIRDQSYRLNVVKMHRLMMDQPMTALERAIWWIEYVLRHGGAKHLRSPAANMSWWQYFEIDLLLAILMFFLFLFTICIFGLFLLYKHVRISKIKIKAH